MIININIKKRLACIRDMRQLKAQLTPQDLKLAELCAKLAEKVEQRNIG